MSNAAAIFIWIVLLLSSMVFPALIILAFIAIRGKKFKNKLEFFMVSFMGMAILKAQQVMQAKVYLPLAAPSATRACTPT